MPQVDVRERIEQLIKDGKKRSEVADILNQEGYKTARDKKVSVGFVNFMLLKRNGKRKSYRSSVTPKAAGPMEAPENREEFIKSIIIDSKFTDEQKIKVLKAILDI